jgi:hypothetical protein
MELGPTGETLRYDLTGYTRTEQAQASDLPRPVAVRPSRGPLALGEAEATYQLINRTVHDD